MHIQTLPGSSQAQYRRIVCAWSRSDAVSAWDMSHKTRGCQTPSQYGVPDMGARHPNEPVPESGQENARTNCHGQAYMQTLSCRTETIVTLVADHRDRTA